MFENNGDRKAHTGYFLPKVEIKNYNVIIDGQNFFDQRVKNDMRTYDKLWIIATGQGDDYTKGCLLEYHYFKKHYKMIAINLSKQQALDVDLKEIQQINFSGNLGVDGMQQCFSLLKKRKNKMTQCNTLNVILSNSQLSKSKSRIKNGTEVTLNLSSNEVGDSDDETNFPDKLLLTDTQVSRLYKAVWNNSSVNIKLSKTQLSKMIKLGRFFEFCCST